MYYYDNRYTRRQSHRDVVYGVMMYYYDNRYTLLQSHRDVVYGVMMYWTITTLCTCTCSCRDVCRRADYITMLCLFYTYLDEGPPSVECVFLTKSRTKLYRYTGWDFQTFCSFSTLKRQHVRHEDMYDLSKL